MRPTVLISYAFLKDMKEADLERTLDLDAEILLDCGAFTALNAGYPIELDDYCKFLDKNREKFFAYLALDVVGNPKATDENFATMLKRGLKPVPVHVRGDDGERMDFLFDHSDFVACAGLRRPHRGWCGKPYIKQKMTWAKGRNVHWLGYTKIGMLGEFRPYSCDSSNVGSGARWGRAQILDPRNGKKISGSYRDWAGGKAYDLKVKPILERWLDFHKIEFDEFLDVKQWRNKTSDHAYAVCDHLSIRSEMAFSVLVRRQFGTRVFLAIMPGVPNFDHVCEIIRAGAWCAHEEYFQ